MTELEKAKEHVREAEEDLSCAKAKLAELKAEPKIVTFETLPFKALVFDAKQVLIQHGHIDQFDNIPLHVAVSKEKFAAIPGNLVASGVAHIRRPNQTLTIDGIAYGDWVEDNAEDGYIVSITNPLRGE